jgi:hypothetical protein
MAALAQTSGPLTDDNFTDDQWITKFGYDAGITGDTDGTAYGLTLPPATDTVEIGSATIDSAAAVGGYGHGIPAGSTQSLEIPASTNLTIGRTDLIVLRYSTAFATDPGPVRLVRIAGTEGSAAIPSHNTTQPTPVDMVLYAITRKQGQGLNQATVVDRRSRAGWHYLMPAGTPLPPLPQTAPLGSTATRAGSKYRRDFVGAAVDWVLESAPRVVLAGTATASDGDDWDVQAASRLSRDGVERWANLVVNLDGASVNPDPEVDGERRVARIASADYPAASVALAGFVQNTAGIKRAASGRIDTDGWVVWHWASTTNRFPTGSTITLTGKWELNA